MSDMMGDFPISRGDGVVEVEVAGKVEDGDDGVPYM